LVVKTNNQVRPQGQQGKDSVDDTTVKNSNSFKSLNGHLHEASYVGSENEKDAKGLKVDIEVARPARIIRSGLQNTNNKNCEIVPDRPSTRQRKQQIEG
jgi:ribosomal protein S3